MFSVEPDKFKFQEFGQIFEGQRVLITGAGKDGGIGQGFAIAAGLNGAESVGVHFNRSYQDGFDLVTVLEEHGVNAFPLQADVTSFRDLWDSRKYVIEQMGGKPPSLLICNSGLSESGYSFGRALRSEEQESMAMRRARVRQHFIDSLEDSRRVLDTKVDGFLAMTHLWAGEALYHQSELKIVYVSSRQAIDPGPAVPGYAISNWAVLQMPQVLEVNLGKHAEAVTALSVLFPFIRTSMTNEYVENEKVFGRWQPRMLETHECAEAFVQLLAQPNEQLRNNMFELMVDKAEQGEDSVEVTWRQVALSIEEHALDWSTNSPRLY